ncbi:unnamed protein product [Brassica napus]|uniref:(rape) hypothetical protein n=1 Tax=Brassica napus TaxID=3708 RepID=A0A816YTZ5_BRANA|nr:unnamed protein product [Brassica napus]
MRHCHSFVQFIYTDFDFCKHTKKWYCYGNTVAEWETQKVKGVDCRLGGAKSGSSSWNTAPVSDSAVNASLVHILKYLTGSAKTYANLTQVYVNVRNVALGHVMVYDTQRLRPLHLFQK